MEYSLVHAVIVAPLPYPDPDRLALIRQVVPEIAQQHPIVGVNQRSFLLWQASCQSTCDGMAAFTADSATLTGDSQTEGLTGLRATPELFDLLGVAPLHGRLFTAADAATSWPSGSHSAPPPGQHARNYSIPTIV